MLWIISFMLLSKKCFLKISPKNNNNCKIDQNSLKVCEHIVETQNHRKVNEVSDPDSFPTKSFPAHSFISD